MEKFNFFKKSIDNSKKIIKSAVIAGSILLSAEQGLAQNLPSKNERYIPDKNWSFDKDWMMDNGSVKYEAVKKSKLYDNYFEHYVMSSDSSYNFSGYVTEDGMEIRTLPEIDSDIVKEKKQIEYYSNSENIKKKFDDQFTPEHKEKVYNDLIKDIKDKVDELRFSLDLKDMSLKYNKKLDRTPEQEKEIEDEFNLFNNSLTYYLNNKDKVIKDDKLMKIMTYEEMVSGFGVGKEESEIKLKKLLEETKKVEDYINDSKINENKN